MGYMGIQAHLQTVDKAKVCLWRRALASVCLLLALCFGFVPSAHADELKVYVGYSGGPYYLKHTYSDSDLWALAAQQGNQRYQYSFMDKGQNRLVKAYGWGPTLESIFSNAYDSSTGTAVNPSQLWRFHMGTTDNYIPDDSGIENGGYGFSAWWWTNTSGSSSGSMGLGIARYCYPTLGGTYTYTDAAGNVRTGSNFDYEESTLDSARLDAISSDGYQVPPIIALRSSWIRITSAKQWDAETGPTSPDACTNYSNRLLFGQSSPSDLLGVASAHSVNAVLCIYAGKPDVEVTTDSGDSSFYGDIGTTITVKATVTSADALIDQNAADYVKWSITDDNGDDVSDSYQLTRNDDGTYSFTITGNGNIHVNANYGNSSADQFTSSGSMGGGGPHSDYDPSQGSGQTYGSDTGAGGGSSGGDGTGGGGSGGGGTIGSGTSGSGANSSAASASGSAAAGGGAASQARYEVQKVIDENSAEQLQPDIDISQLPWGGILLVLAIVLGAALARVGAYLWDVDRRRYLTTALTADGQEVSAA